MTTNPTLVLRHIDENYLTDYTTFICCDEIQFAYYCENHFEKMGCMFCQFDPYTNCEEQH
jgi:hypothetical protein